MSDSSRRRPWLAVLLAIVISGLGHAYLRRWARAFGWYVAITATVVVFVPDAAVEGILAGDRAPISELAPAIVVVAASVVDAYVVAIRNNREHEQRTNATARGERDPSQSPDTPRTAWNGDGGSEDTVRSESLERTNGTTDETVSCPHCGRESDPSFDFCQWCAESIDS